MTVSTSPNTNDYYIAVSKNALKVGYRSSDSSTVRGWYAGLFQPFLSTSDDANEFPLCLSYGGSSAPTGLQSVSTANFTPTSRHPKRVSQSATTGNHVFAADTTWGPSSGDTSTVDAFFAKAQAPKVMIRAQQTPVSTFGGLRGLLYDVRYLPRARALLWGREILWTLIPSYTSISPLPSSHL
jgi:hypothetical protein